LAEFRHDHGDLSEDCVLCGDNHHHGFLIHDKLKHPHSTKMASQPYMTGLTSLMTDADLKNELQTNCVQPNHTSTISSDSPIHITIQTGTGSGTVKRHVALYTLQHDPSCPECPFRFGHQIQPLSSDPPPPYNFQPWGNGRFPYYYQVTLNQNDNFVYHVVTKV
jgi:hypothetical protein